MSTDAADPSEQQLRRLVGRYPNSPVATYARLELARRRHRGVNLDYDDVRNVLTDHAIVQAILTAIEDEKP